MEALKQRQDEIMAMVEHLNRSIRGNSKEAESLIRGEIFRLCTESSNITTYFALNHMKFGRYAGVVVGLHRAQARAA